MLCWPHPVEMSLEAEPLTMGGQRHAALLRGIACIPPLKTIKAPSVGEFYFPETDSFIGTLILCRHEWIAFKVLFPGPRVKESFVHP